MPLMRAQMKTRMTKRCQRTRKRHWEPPRVHAVPGSEDFSLHQSVWSDRRMRSAGRSGIGIGIAHKTAHRSQAREFDAFSSVRPLEPLGFPFACGNAQGCDRAKHHC